MKNINVRIEKVILTFAFISSIFSAKSQTYNDIVSDSTVSQFVISYLDNCIKEIDVQYQKRHPFIISTDEIIDPKKLSSQLDNWNLIFEDSEMNIDSLFNFEDKLFIIKQEQTRKKFTWKIKHNIFEFKDLKNGESHYRLSMPLFSKSKNIVIIKRSFECGDDCGDSLISIYRKRNKTWELISGWGYII